MPDPVESVIISPIIFSNFHTESAASKITASASDNAAAASNTSTNPEEEPGTIFEARNRSRHVEEAVLEPTEHFLHAIFQKMKRALPTKLQEPLFLRALIRRELLLLS